MELANERIGLIFSDCLWQFGRIIAELPFRRLFLMPGLLDSRYGFIDAFYGHRFTFDEQGFYDRDYR